MKFNRSEIMKQAWDWTKRDRAYHERRDILGTKPDGRLITKPRPATAAEKRALFARYLRQSWIIARSSAVVRKPLTERERIAQEIEMLANKSFCVPITARRMELEAKLARAA